MMCEMRENGVFNYPRKEIHVSFAYVNNLYKTMQRSNEALEKANESQSFVQEHGYPANRLISRPTTQTIIRLTVC